MISQLPDIVIVNIKNALDVFKQHVNKVDSINFHAKKIIHSIVNCLDNKVLAEWKLREFVAEIEFDEKLRNNDTIHKNSYSSAVLTLGLAVLAELDQLHLYDQNDTLPYEYDDRDYNGFSGLILSRINDDQ
jgi:hypothetical protein